MLSSAAKVQSPAGLSNRYALPGEGWPVQATGTPPELLAHMASRAGWKRGERRGYRVKIQYPAYGWQASIAFTPPAAPVS